MDAGTYIHVTADARYVVAGDLYEIEGDRLVELTEATRRALRREIVARAPEDGFVVFGPDGAAQASVVVFTDSGCEYCRRLHATIAEYVAKGIEIRYAAYPRAGIGSSTYEDMVSAWCAEDRRAALARN